jgi:hypothetical protein
MKPTRNGMRQPQDWNASALRKYVSSAAEKVASSRPIPVPICWKLLM